VNPAQSSSGGRDDRELITGAAMAAIDADAELPAPTAWNLAAQQAIHRFLGVQCRHLDAYSYGLVQVDAATGTATVTLKDAAGDVIQDQVTSASCVKRLGN
jgi:hypothetical protein